MNISPVCDSHLSNFRHESSQSPSMPPAVSLEDANEERLLYLIKFGTNKERKKAITVIYDRHEDRIAKMIDNKGIQLADAEDIYAEVWKIILEKLPTFEYKGTPLWHWFSRITKIQINAYFRKRTESNGRYYDTHDDWLEMLGYVEELIEDKKMSSPSPHIQKLIDQTLPKLMAKLSDTQKAVILYTFYRDMDSTEIAKKLQSKPGTVRQQKKRALDKLVKLGAKGV